MTRILVIDDDQEQANRMAARLMAAGYHVTCATDSLEGLVAVEDESPDLVILDWAMPFITGAIILKVMRTGLKRPPPVIAVIGSDVNPDEILAAGAGACLYAPPDLGAIPRLVGALLTEQAHP